MTALTDTDLVFDSQSVLLSRMNEVVEIESVNLYRLGDNQAER